MSPSGWAGFLSHYLSQVNSQLFTQSLQDAYDDELVTTALRGIDQRTCRVPDSWFRLESLIEEPMVTRPFLVERLIVSASTLKEAISAANGPSYSTKQLRTKLITALPEHSSVSPREAPFPRLWPRVADAIARLIVSSTEAKTAQWKGHALLSLAGVVQLLTESRPSAAAKRLNHLATRSILGFRGTATRLPSEIRDGRILDPVTAPRAVTRRAIQTHSRLLLEADNALCKLEHDDSPLVSLLDHNAPVAPERQRYAALMPAIRKATYRQYDSLLALLLAYSGLEHTLRSRLTRLNISHWRTDGRPLSVRRFFDRLSLSTDLQEALNDIYDPARANTRNRVFHSGYMMVEHCRPRIVDQVLAYGQYVPDSHSPEVALHHATWLLGELTNLWSVVDLDFSWIPSGALDERFRTLLQHIPVELASASALKHDAQLTLYLTSVAPTLSTLSKLATVQTLRSPQLSLLAALFVFFEGLLRNTMTLMNVPTLSIARRTGGLTAYTLMMDEEGLLSPGALGRLTKALPEHHRTVAADYLRGVVNVRNRFAHGCLLDMPSETIGMLGAAIYKLSSLMAAAGTHHMIEEGAYFSWKNGSTDPAANWVNSERAVFRELRHRAGSLPSLERE